MGSLNYEEKMMVQLLRNKKSGLKPGSVADIATKFNISKVYAYTVIQEKQKGKSATEWRHKFAVYAGMENE